MNKSTLVLSLAVAVLGVVVIVQSRNHNQSDSKSAESKVTSPPPPRSSLGPSTETSSPPLLSAGTQSSESSAIQLPQKEDVSKPVPTKGPTDPREIFHAASKSVVLIKTFDSSGSPMMIGSGFFVENTPANNFFAEGLKEGVNGGPKGFVPDKGWNDLGGGFLALVTNAHVIAGASRIKYENSAGNEGEITNFLSIDVDGDLVVLVSTESTITNADTLPFPELKLSQREPEIGEHIYVIGNPHGLTQTLSDGLVSAVRNIANEEVVQITAPISPGSSGGPVLNSNGEVVGVASFYIEGGENLNFAISSKRLAILLSQDHLRPISIALSSAGHVQNLQDMVHGRDRVQIVGYENSASGIPNSIGVTIKNNESRAVGSISFRITYYRDPAVALKARLAQLEAERGRSGVSNLSMFNMSNGRVRDLESYLRVLERDPSTWTLTDLGDIPESSIELKIDARILLTDGRLDYSQRQHIANQARAVVPDEKKKTQDALVYAREQLENARNEKEAREQQLKEIEAAIQQVTEQLKAPPPSAPVDYEDIVQPVGVGSGLTRTVDLTLSHLRSGWTCNYRILDYEILATQ